MTLIGIQLVYADFHTATNMIITYILYFQKTYTNTLDFSRKSYILYNYIAYVRILSTNIRKFQDYLILYNLHSIKGANFPYKIPSDWIETSNIINLIKSGTEINFMILLFSLLSSFPFRKIGIACFTKFLTKCFMLYFRELSMVCFLITYKKIYYS